jgi:lysyl-tRNA synthetase class 2
VNWQPSSPAIVAERRARMLARARTYFSERDVLEVETPALNRTTASDPRIQSYFVETSGRNELILQTSPESYMKRLLAAGYPDIFSICRVFRDGEIGPRHQPEFTMIEWYRHGFGLDSIVAETTSLIATVIETPAMEEVQNIEYQEAFLDLAGIDPFAATISQLAQASDADPSLRASIGDDRDAWLDLLLSTKVSTRFPDDRLTVLQHYPASQAALARLCPRDPAVADRFEIFFGSLELANGFVELRDSAEQRRRFEADNAAREAVGMRTVPVDEALLAALESGLPACAGVAAGLDRLLMVALGRSDIREVLTFASDETTG